MCIVDAYHIRLASSRALAYDRDAGLQSEVRVNGVDFGVDLLMLLNLFLSSRFLGPAETSGACIRARIR